MKRGGSMKKKRKKYSPEQKVAILKKHLVDKIPLSDICDQHGLHPTVFYRWQKMFFENGPAAFTGTKESEVSRFEKKISALENKLTRKNEVLSELMEEHVALKKSLGEL
jgi:transposase-like protein